MIVFSCKSSEPKEQGYELPAMAPAAVKPAPPWNPPPKLDRPRKELAAVAPPWLKPLNAPECIPVWS